jgi:ABC-2 type transport system ATP-binding protein
MNQEINFQSLSVTLKRKSIIKELTFTAKPGQITGLLGKNGAGKTTALRALTELIDATNGSALIGGNTFSHRKPGEVGVMLTAQFPATRTVLSQLKLSALAAHVGESAIEKIIDELELANFLNKRFRTLSLGMKQRVAIGCALIADPQFLIMDEPVNALDPDGIHWLHQTLKEQARLGKTILISSHYLNDMEKYVDHVVMIQNELLWQGTWSAEQYGSLSDFFAMTTQGHEIA